MTAFDERERLTLCPYCLTPLEVNAVLCPACHLDTTADARIEVTRREYEDWPRVPCPHCGRLIRNLANPCPECGGQTRAALD